MTAIQTTDLPQIARESLIPERLPIDGARVIDIGCGDGWLTRLVAPVAEAAIGIDPSATALKRAEADNRCAKASFLLAPAERMPLDRASVDIAIYFNSLHHVPADHQPAAFEETARVLKPGGLLCVVEPVASGAAYELYQPFDDESDVYASSYRLILELEQGDDFAQVTEELFVDYYDYRDFDEFYDRLLLVDESRAEGLASQKDSLRSRFESLGEAFSDGRRFDQVLRFSLLRRS